MTVLWIVVSVVGYVVGGWISYNVGPCGRKADARWVQQSIVAFWPLAAAMFIVFLLATLVFYWLSSLREAWRILMKEE